jgi:hypothetical protein
VSSLLLDFHGDTPSRNGPITNERVLLATAAPTPVRSHLTRSHQARRHLAASTADAELGESELGEGDCQAYDQCLQQVDAAQESCLQQCGDDFGCRDDCRDKAFNRDANCSSQFPGCQ